MTDAKKIVELECAKKRKMDDIRDLEGRYGHGVRPGWVSTDISIAWAKVQDIDAQLKDLQQ